MYRAITLLMALAACACPSSAGLAFADGPPPPARKVDLTEQHFGLTISDPYRWMEGEKNPEFAAWLSAQGEYARQRLDALPTLARWRERLGAAARAGVINRLQTPMGGRVFFLRLQNGKEGVLMVRDRQGEERVLWDPAANMTDKGAASVTAFAPSPDGRRVAVNVQSGGAEITRIVLIDVDTVRMLDDKIDDVWGELTANWLADGSGFTYTQLAPAGMRNATDFSLDQRVFLHRIGATGADEMLIARGARPEASLDPHEFPVVTDIKNSHFGLLTIGGARPQVRVCVAPRQASMKPHADWRCLIGYDDNVQQAALHGDVLYFVSMLRAPNGRLLKLDLSRSLDVKRASVVLAEDASDVLTGIAPARDALYVRKLHDGPDRIVRVSYGGAVATVPTAFVGSAFLLATDPQADGLVYTLQGWIKPRMAFRYLDGTKQSEDLHLGATVAADYSNLVAEETTARSRDGTLVPLSIIHRRDATAERPGIAILDGYGGYGISMQPFFDPLTLEWVEAGHVYAVAHVRGGGEKGDRWRVEGSGAAKERGVEDFIGCAQALQSLAWAKPAGVLAKGASMGGVLVGGALTRSPESFGAAVIQAGELNPSRLIAAANGANQFAEVGDPHTEDGFRNVVAMDPYLRIKQDTFYPAVLLVVGLNDNRVSPWESGKFGARLAAADGGRQPVWFRTDGGMGHFNTAQNAQALELADVYAFAEAEIPQGPITSAPQ